MRQANYVVPVYQQHTQNVSKYTFVFGHIIIIYIKLLQKVVFSLARKRTGFRKAT